MKMGGGGGGGGGRETEGKLNGVSPLFRCQDFPYQEPTDWDDRRVGHDCPAPCSLSYLLFIGVENKKIKNASCGKHVGRKPGGKKRERETERDDLVCWWHFALEDSLVVTRSVECLKCETRIKCSVKNRALLVSPGKMFIFNNTIWQTMRKRKSRCSDTRASSREKGIIFN